jgi:hypothetical protein
MQARKNSGGTRVPPPSHHYDTDTARERASLKGLQEAFLSEWRQYPSISTGTTLPHVFASPSGNSPRPTCVSEPVPDVIAASPSRAHKLEKCVPAKAISDL